MPGISIDKKHCKGCQLCVHACPQKILGISSEITDRGYLYAQTNDPSRCIGCRLCAIICPDAAIEVSQSGMTYALFEY